MYGVVRRRGKEWREQVHVKPERLTVARNGDFRGNKAVLPSKPCAACGLPMTWRRNWAKNWAEVTYCSDACRRAWIKRV